MEREEFMVEALSHLPTDALEKMIDLLNNYEADNIVRAILRQTALAALRRKTEATA